LGKNGIINHLIGVIRIPDNSADCRIYLPPTVDTFILAKADSRTHLAAKMALNPIKLLLVAEVLVLQAFFCPGANLHSAVITSEAIALVLEQQFYLIHAKDKKTKVFKDSSVKADHAGTIRKTPKQRRVPKLEGKKP
jgi:hypothetical protein